MTPKSFNLPFPSYRPGQLEAAVEIASAQETTVVLRAATGSGKSLVNATVAALIGGRSLYLVRTKRLQDQITRDFPNIMSLVGHGNYSCGRSTPIAELGLSYLDCDSVCQWKEDIEIAKNRDSVITNFANWSTLVRSQGLGALGEFDSIVIDEVHTLPSALCDLLRTDLDSRIFPGLPLKIPITGSVIKWARGFIGDLDKDDGESILKRFYTKRTRDTVYRLLQITRQGVEDFLNCPKEYVITKERGKSISLYPILGGKQFYNRLIPSGVSKIILCSATPGAGIAKRLGFSRSAECLMPIQFAVENRPVIVISGVPSVTYDMTKEDRLTWLRTIEEIVHSLDDSRGVIHTKSYARAKEITDFLSSKRVWLHDGSLEMLNRFLTGSLGYNAVLVSPVIEEGVNLSYEKGEWQVIAKVPFPDFRDPIIRARQILDKTWSDQEIAISVEQATGRVVRYEDDRGVTFICDGSFMPWYKKNKNLFNPWFDGAVQEMSLSEAIGVSKELEMLF